jgi:hypothetical protein
VSQFDTRRIIFGANIGIREKKARLVMPLTFRVPGLFRAFLGLLLVESEGLLST